jgi:IS5 family transposase
MPRSNKGKTINRYKETGRVGLFDIEETLSDLTAIGGNPLGRLKKAIDFEMFREELENHILNHDKKNNAGSKPYDVVMMFKIILIKRLNNLSDEETERMIKDRLTFRDFVGLSIGDKVPDARTIWSFQDKLSENNLGEKLFARFNRYLEELGLFTKEGQLIDATIVEVPRQRNKKEENEKIKAGEGEELWNDTPQKKCQKDIDARWTRKRGQNYYGYKDHTKVDRKSKLITNYEVTSAAVHDSQAIEKLLEEGDKGQEIYADSAYIGAGIDGMLRERGMSPQISERSHKGKPLTAEQKEQNRKKSKTRCRVEHVYGFMKNSMKGFYIRVIGYQRAKGVIGLMNLVYNLCRYEQIVRLNLLPVK